METPVRKKWFKRKLYGWGWQPATWEGWLCLAVFIGFNLLNFFRLEKLGRITPDTAPLGFIVPFIVTTILLIWLAYVKGEKPKWQWGKRIED